MAEKRCSRCKRTVAEGIRFGKNSSAPDGLSWYCLECARAIAKERRERNRDTINARARDLYRLNADRMRQQKAEWRLRNPEKVKEIITRYRLRNSEALRQRDRDRYWADVTASRIASRRKYWADPVRARRLECLRRSKRPRRRPTDRQRWSQRRYYWGHRAEVLRRRRLREPSAPKRHRRGGHSRLQRWMADPTALDPSAVLTTREAQSPSLAWLQSLPASDQALLTAYADSGLDIVATADALQVSVAVAQTRLNHLQAEARQALLP